MKYKIGMLAAALMALFAFGAGATAKKIGGYQTYIGAVADTTGLTVDPGSRYFATDNGKTYIHNGAGWIQDAFLSIFAAGDSVKARILPTATVRTDTNTVNAPGNSKAIATNGYPEASFWWKVAKKATSATVRFQAYFAKLGWASIDAENDTTVVTANGVNVRSFRFAASADSLREQFVSEAGGDSTAVTFGISLAQPNK
jgi:hypothetical protein